MILFFFFLFSFSSSLLFKNPHAYWRFEQNVSSCVYVRFATKEGRKTFEKKRKKRKGTNEKKSYKYVRRKKKKKKGERKKLSRLLFIYFFFACVKESHKVWLSVSEDFVIS